MYKYQYIYQELVRINRRLIAIANQLEYGDVDEDKALFEAVSLENRREMLINESNEISRSLKGVA